MYSICMLCDAYMHKYKHLYMYYSCMYRHPKAEKHVDCSLSAKEKKNVYIYLGNDMRVSIKTEMYLKMIQPGFLPSTT